MSPSGARGVTRSANGSASEKRPPPPQQQQQSTMMTDGPIDGGAGDNGGAVRERAFSPEQGRVKSPALSSASRATSPNGEVYTPPSVQQPNIASVVGSNGFAARARSPSPRQQPYTVPGTGPGRAVSPTPQGVHRPGSTGNVTADLIRELKAKETEMEGMKKREAWLKVVLTKASRAGFVYEDGDLNEAELLELSESVSAKESGPAGDRLKEMAVKFKQLKAIVQVRSPPRPLSDFLFKTEL
jgi:hypothetical protein